MADIDKNAELVAEWYRCDEGHKFKTFVERGPDGEAPRVIACTYPVIRTDGRHETPGTCGAKAVRWDRFPDKPCPGCGRMFELDDDAVVGRHPDSGQWTQDVWHRECLNAAAAKKGGWIAGQKFEVNASEDLAIAWVGTFTGKGASENLDEKLRAALEQHRSSHVEAGGTIAELGRLLATGSAAARVTVGQDVSTGSTFAVGPADSIFGDNAPISPPQRCPECGMDVTSGQIWVTYNRDVEPRGVHAWHYDCHHARFAAGHAADCKREECSCSMRFL